MTCGLLIEGPLVTTDLLTKRSADLSTIDQPTIDRSTALSVLSTLHFSYPACRVREADVPDAVSIKNVFCSKEKCPSPSSRAKEKERRKKKKKKNQKRTVLMTELVKMVKSSDHPPHLKGIANGEARCAAITFAQVMGRAAAFHIPGGKETWLSLLKGLPLYEVLAPLLDVSNASPLYDPTRNALMKEAVDPLLRQINESGRNFIDLIEASQVWMEGLGKEASLPFYHERRVIRTCLCGSESLAMEHVAYFTIGPVQEPMEDLLLHEHEYTESMECKQCKKCTTHTVREQVHLKGMFVLVRVGLQEGEGMADAFSYPASFQQKKEQDGGQPHIQYGILAIGLSFPGHFTALLRSSVQGEWVHANDGVVEQVAERPQGARTALLLYARDAAVDAAAARMCQRDPGSLPLKVDIQFCQWSLRKRAAESQGHYPSLRELMKKGGMEIDEEAWEFLAELEGQELETVISQSPSPLAARKELKALKAARAPGNGKKTKSPLFASAAPKPQPKEGTPKVMGGPWSVQEGTLGNHEGQQQQPQAQKMAGSALEVRGSPPTSPTPVTLATLPQDANQMMTGLASGQSPPLSPSMVIVTARTELLSIGLARNPGMAPPPDDASTARATLERTAAAPGFLIGNHVRERLVQPHLLPGNPSARASMLAAEVRAIPDLYRWIVDGAPAPGPMVPPLHAQALRFVAENIQRRMDRLIVQTEIDACRAHRGVHEFISHHEMLSLLQNIGRADMLTATERAPQRRPGPKLEK